MLNYDFLTLISRIVAFGSLQYLGGVRFIVRVQPNQVKSWAIQNTSAIFSKLRTGTSEKNQSIELN